MSTNGIGGKSYDEFLQSIKARGLGTTSLGNGEANFADYANALSSDLKEELLQSIGDEAGDAALQSKVAGLFGGSSVLQYSEVIAAAEAAGLSCSVEYVSTSYIIDNKADGHYDTDVTQGAIAVYTFSDGNSTIKIADANGNGALEAEEIFLNEILGDVTNTLGASSSSSATAGTSAIDIAKMQQDILLKQIEDSKKRQQEMMKQMQESLETSTESKEAEEEGNAPDSQSQTEMSQSEFEKAVLDKAISSYAGKNISGVSAIEKAMEKVADEYGVNFDLSASEMIELGKSFSKASQAVKDKEQEEAKKADSEDSSTESVDDEQSVNPYSDKELNSDENEKASLSQQDDFEQDNFFEDDDPFKKRKDI